MSENNKSHKQLVDLAVSELSQILADVENGKIPNISPRLKKLMEKTSSTLPKANSMTEADVEQWTEETLKELDPSKEK